MLTSTALINNIPSHPSQSELYHAPVRRVSSDSLQMTQDAMMAALTTVVSDDDDDSVCCGNKRSRETTSFTTKKRRRTQQTSVPKMLRFAVDPEIITPSRPYLDRAANNASWYTRKELTAMKVTCKKMAQQSSPALKHELFALHNSNTAPACFSPEFQYRRGLERWSSALHYQARAMDILQSKSAVFIEQSTQQLERTTTQAGSVEQLAVAYRDTTAKARQFAMALAMSDVEECKLL